MQIQLWVVCQWVEATGAWTRPLSFLKGIWFQLDEKRRALRCSVRPDEWFSGLEWMDPCVVYRRLPRLAQRPLKTLTAPVCGDVTSSQTTLAWRRGGGIAAAVARRSVKCHLCSIAWVTQITTRQSPLEETQCLGLAESFLWYYSGRRQGRI